VELLTVQETAALLRVAPVTVRRYIAAGRLATVRVGRGVRVQREAVERFVGAVPAPTPSATMLPPGEPTSAEDPLWSLIGIFDADADGATDVAEHKHRYLADAYDAVKA